MMVAKEKRREEIPLGWGLKRVGEEGRRRRASKMTVGSGREGDLGWQGGTVRA